MQKFQHKMQMEKIQIQQNTNVTEYKCTKIQLEQNKNRTKYKKTKC